MKKKAIPALALLALVLTGCASSQQPEDSAYRQITMQEAVEMMAEEENYIILDVRTEAEFASGHIPGRNPDTQRNHRHGGDCAAS